MFKFIARVTVVALPLCGMASAQYVGPGGAGGMARTPFTITDVLASPVDGQNVQLRGRLLQKLNRNKYLFSDGKSQIRVEIDDDKFPKQPIDDRTDIQIMGEVEKDFMETPEIDVDQVEIVPPQPSTPPKR